MTPQVHYANDAAATAVVILAHGSRHPRACAGIDALAQAVAQRMHLPAVAAYLELAQPSLGAAIEQLQHELARLRQVVVVPALFSDAYHLNHDVPQAIAASQANTELRLLQAPPIGTGPDLAAILAQRRHNYSAPQNHPEAVHHVLWAVGSSHSSANDHVRQLARTAGLSETIFATQDGRSRLEAAAAQHRHLHLSPLFVSEGLLLDLATEVAAAHPTVTVGPPLSTDLAPLIHDRVRHSLNDLTLEVTV